MIVAYQPGGSVRDARVVLKPEEKIPTRYNTKEAIVYREDGNGKWVIVKDLFVVLPVDSPLLSQPAIPEVETLDLTNGENSDTLFEHRDIIRLEDE